VSVDGGEDQFKGRTPAQALQEALKIKKLPPLQPADEGKEKVAKNKAV